MLGPPVNLEWTCTFIEVGQTLTKAISAYAKLVKLRLSVYSTTQYEYYAGKEYTKNA
jgi:hypothetical protein